MTFPTIISDYSIHGTDIMSKPRQFAVAGKVCVVTGGGSGIGAALCEEMCARGARVVIVADINFKNASLVAERLAKTGTVVQAVKCDVSKEGEIRKMISFVKINHGPIQIFAANAGITGGFGGPEVSNDEWELAVQVNTMHIIWAARHCLPDMLAAKEGGFIITASAAGLLTQVGGLPYAVTKAAAVSVAEWLAFTHYDDNIGVTCLCPQAVDTDMIAASKGGGVAGVDGILKPDHVARFTLDAYQQGKLLALPHASVEGYMKAKATMPDKWIRGMSRLHKATDGGLVAPHLKKQGKAKL